MREGASPLELRLETAPVLQGVELGQPALLEYARALEGTAGGSTLAPPAALRVLASKACRRAIMFGDVLSLAQCQGVLSALALCEMPFQCAHGRPTVAPLVDFEALEHRSSSQL